MSTLQQFKEFMDTPVTIPTDCSPPNRRRWVIVALCVILFVLILNSYHGHQHAMLSISALRRKSDNATLRGGKSFGLLDKKRISSLEDEKADVETIIEQVSGSTPYAPPWRKKGPSQRNQRRESVNDTDTKFSENSLYSSLDDPEPVDVKDTDSDTDFSSRVSFDGDSGSIPSKARRSFNTDDDSYETFAKRRKPRKASFDAFEDDEYETKRPPPDLDSNEDLNKQAISDLKQEEERLERRIARFQEKDRLEQMRSALAELRERQKLRDSLDKEAAWQEEVEDHRERERQRRRTKWNVEEARHRTWLRGVYEPSIAEDPTLNELEFKRSNWNDKEAWRRGATCSGLKPVTPFRPYGEYLSNIQVTDNAYVTYVSSAEFVLGAAVLMYSIAISGSQYARAVCVTADITANDRKYLSTFGQVIEIEKIPSPLYVENLRYRDTFTKLRIWQLAMFQKVLYIDTDVIVLRSMDELFDLNEWSVPMDAEQNRYSTGMMLCEPSLDTFDKMMAKLKTTKVSMELPDLLFLREYFEGEATTPKAPSNAYWSDVKSGQGKINIIPRWYQVYQEEFGSEYHTYLTKRKQKITIYDERIHGIHYPGASKPWLKFSERNDRYKRHLCEYPHVSEFQYDPHFHWYRYFAMMKNALAESAQSVAFDAETGTGGSTVLTLFVEQKKKQIEEEKKRYSWESPSYDRSKYDNSYPEPDQSSSRNSNRYSNWNPPAPSKAPLEDGNSYQVADCTVYEDATSTGSKRQLLQLPDGPEKMRKPYFSPNELQGNDAALSDEAAPGDFETVTLSEPVPVTESPHGGKALVDLSNLPAFAVQLPQHLIGSTVSLEDYIWVVTFCSKSKVHPAKWTTCGKSAYVSQYSGSQCRTNFDDYFSMTPIYRRHQKPDDRIAGVVLRSGVQLEDPERTKWIDVVVRCDWTMADENVTLERNVSSVPIDVVHPPHDRRYTLRLRSRCACEGGCGAAKRVVEKKQLAKKVVALRAELFGKAFEAKRSNADWRRVTFAATCFAVPSLAADRCIDMSYCDYMVSGRRCVPNTSIRWFPYRTQSQNTFCNCTHVGGSGDSPMPSLKECFRRAEDSNANAVNYAFGVAPSSDAPTSARSSEPLRKAVRGCYYKRCGTDLGMSRDLLRARVPLHRSDVGNMGFDVHIRNPFWLNETLLEAFVAKKKDL